MRLSLAAGMLCILSACATARPAPAGPFPSPIVRLVDSLAWADDLGEGTHRRVEVRTASRVDTIRGVRTFDLPIVMGDTMLRGFAYKDDRIAFGYEYNVRSRRMRRVSIPADMSIAMSGAALSPDGRHVAYVTSISGPLGYGIVRAWPGGEPMLRSRSVEVPATDNAGGNQVRWLAADTVEMYVEAGCCTDVMWYRVRASLNPPRILAADTVTTLPP